MGPSLGVCTRLDESEMGDCRKLKEIVIFRFQLHVTIYCGPVSAEISPIAIIQAGKGIRKCGSIGETLDKMGRTFWRKILMFKNCSVDYLLGNISESIITTQLDIKLSSIVNVRAKSTQNHKNKKKSIKLDLH